GRLGRRPRLRRGRRPPRGRRRRAGGEERAVTELPRPEGRATRVALLVYNDAHADSRVLKTAHSLREAGAEVTILAVARAHLGYPPTAERLPDGVELVRVPEPGFITWVPRLKRTLARGRTLLSARRRAGAPAAG